MDVETAIQSPSPEALRCCRICGENKPLTAFHVRPDGRMKSLCRQCTDDLITAFCGLKNRRCTTCGRPTNNYRCAGCWKKIRAKSYWLPPDFDFS